MSFHKSFASGADTSDATAEQWDIKNGKTAYIASGKVTGSGYFPAMVNCGAASYYGATYTSSGNKVTATIMFKRASFTGGGTECLMRAQGPTGDQRLGIRVHASDHATVGRRSKLDILVQNSAGTEVCRLWSTASVCDDEVHTLFFGFDGDAGTAVFKLDGADDDDTGNGERVAPTTGTLESGASSVFLVGANSTTPNQIFLGQLGFLGYRDVGGLSWSDFMQTDGSPKQISEASASPQWAEWGAQPPFWHESGKMDENKGSAGAMTANGTITLAAASSWS